MDNVEEIINTKEFKNTDIIDKLLKNNYKIEDIAKALVTVLMNADFTNKSNSLISENGSNISYEFTPDEKGNVRLFLNVGRKDKVMVKDIIGCFKAHTALNTDTIGRVNLLDNFSFVEIPAEFVNEVMRNVKGQVIKGKSLNIEIANN